MLFHHKNLKSITIFASIFFIFSSAQAASLKKLDAPSMLVSSKNAIVNLDQALLDIKAKTHIPVIFPTQVPAIKAGQKYYINSVVGADGNSYVISVGDRPDCNGVKYCSIGTISGVLGQRPQIYSAVHGPDLTEPVELAGDNRGYFTSAHAEADYWPSLLEWRIDNVLYSVSWKLSVSNEKQMLVGVANSALQSGNQ